MTIPAGAPRIRWARLALGEPPTAEMLMHWEGEGWEIAQMLGPCPIVDPKTRQTSGAAYVVYLKRSPLAPAATRPPGIPVPRGQVRSS